MYHQIFWHIFLFFDVWPSSIGGVNACHLSHRLCLFSSCNHYFKLRKLIFHFLPYWMGYDRDDSFPFDSEPNGNPFGSKLKGKLSPRSYPIQCERKWKYSFLSVTTWWPLFDLGDISLLFPCYFLLGCLVQLNVQ